MPGIAIARNAWAVNVYSLQLGPDINARDRGHPPRDVFDLRALAGRSQAQRYSRVGRGQHGPRLHRPQPYLAELSKN
jgi:hypothetical protein